MSLHSGKPIKSDAYKTAVRFARIGMSVKEAEEAVLIFKKRPALVDMIMGHFAGFNSGEFGFLPQRIAETLIDNLATRGIIDWDKIPSIPLTQTDDPNRY